MVFIVAVSVHPAAAQSDKLGLLRIKAEYPVQVPLSYSFSIRLTVEYAFRDYFEIHAAVYEGARGAFNHPLWQGAAENLADVGVKTYDIQLESPSSEGQWTLTGYVFYRDASGLSYFTDQERGPGFVEMRIKVSDNARLTLQAPYRSVPVLVDGAPYSTDQSGVLTRELKVLTEHSIMAPANFTVANGWRAIFQSWNGTDAKNPKHLMIQADVLLTVNFRDEFYLDLVSNVADVRGAGWYPLGVIANFSAPPLVPKGWESVFGVQWRFVSWSGDVESVAPNESIVMDRPHRVVAHWTVDYERGFYPMMIAAAAIAAGLAVLIRRRLTVSPPEETPVPAVRTFCMFCGSSIDPDARFCSKCGRNQVSSS